MKLLVTGGAGFIGSALIRHLVAESTHEVVNLDKLTYAGSLASLAMVEGRPYYRFIKGDVCDAALIEQIFETFDPDCVVHLAAETHVDRSIEGPGEFIRTNLVGTYTLLEGARRHYARLSDERRSRFRFHHVSTDEVYGSLGDTGRFSETTPYDPRSPYSASKAGADHLVSAWGHTFGLPVLISNCSNNYGPYQYPEKIIPLCITHALHGKPLPVYGEGKNVRDCDHARALQLVFERGVPGEVYNIGGNAERRNIDVVTTLCDILDRIRPTNDGSSYRKLIQFVRDRPGHDLRYAIDATKIWRELEWKPRQSFETGIEYTVRWYCENPDWTRQGENDQKGLEQLTGTV